MKIIKNVLSKDDLETLKKELLNPYFPWYFNRYTIDKDLRYTQKGYQNFKGKAGARVNAYEAPQLTHSIIQREKISSHRLDKVGHILDKVYKDFDIKSITRMKFNLQFPHNFQKNEKYNMPHYDNDNIPDLKIIIFYLNTCDSYTYFFKGTKVNKKVKVEENSLVCFDGTILHAGSNPKKTPYKLCLNINYI